MSLGWISVAALVCAVLLSCTTRLNVGVVSLSFAWVVGVYLGDMKLNALLEGFPTPLFTTLVGITLLFSMAELNGTLERVTARGVRLCRGYVAFIPVMFFVVAVILSSIGPGGTATAGLLAPAAMAVAHRSGIAPFPMVLMVGNGALAGTFSPFAPAGIVASGVMERIGLGGVAWKTYLFNLLAHAIVGFGGFLVFGGWRLFAQLRTAGEAAVAPPSALNRQQWLTIAAIIGLLVAVVGFETNIGMSALTAAMFLSITRAADEKASFVKMPWNVIVMVTGVTVLIALMEKTEGLEIFTNLLVRLSSPESVTGLVAFVVGVVSVYSSTSGVVLPAFLPTVPGLAERVGGVDPLAIAWAMNVGSSLVDLSPLSTAGALCLAAVPEEYDGRKLFNYLLAWGFSMTIVGAFLSWVLFR